MSDPRKWIKSLRKRQGVFLMWLQTRIAKTMVASQLAQDAANKKKRTWQEIVPE